MIHLTTKYVEILPQVEIWKGEANVQWESKNKHWPVIFVSGERRRRLDNVTITLMDTIFIATLRRYPREPIHLKQVSSGNLKSPLPIVPKVETALSNLKFIAACKWDEWIRGSTWERDPIGMSMPGISEKKGLNCVHPFTKWLKATVVLSARNNIKISPDQLVRLPICQYGVKNVMTWPQILIKRRVNVDKSSGNRGCCLKYRKTLWWRLEGNPEATWPSFAPP